MELMQLATRRQRLLERAYSGFVDMAAWKQLITDYLAIGANYNAAWCVRKVNELMAQKKNIIVTLRVDTSKFEARLQDAIEAIIRLEYVPYLSVRQMQAVLLLSFIILILVLS